MLYNFRGYTYAKNAQYKEAIKDYSRAIQLGYNDVFTYKRRANLYFKAKQYKRAQTAYTKLFELHENSYYPEMLEKLIYTY